MARAMRPLPSSPNKAALAVTNSGGLPRQAFVAPAELRPFGQFMNVGCHSPRLLRILWGLFSASATVISAGSPRDISAGLLSPRDLRRMGRFNFRPVQPATHSPSARWPAWRLHSGTDRAPVG